MRRALLAVMVVAVPFLLAGCNQAQRDLEGVPVLEPDKAEVYLNIDEYPDITRICIQGVAFATTTRDYQPVIRVPEWDETFCAS